jgi:hypothetical protein
VPRHTIVGPKILKKGTRSGGEGTTADNDRNIRNLPETPNQSTHTQREENRIGRYKCRVKVPESDSYENGPAPFDDLPDLLQRSATVVEVDQDRCTSGSTQMVG